MNMAYGASLLGYGNCEIEEAIVHALREGVLCGHETLHQISLAKKLAELLPSAEMTRFCCTGTEST
jgi:glutamate-1-semialdehyde 2,1-aminomutase